MIIAPFMTIHTAFPYMSHKGLLGHEKTDLQLLFFNRKVSCVMRKPALVILNIMGLKVECLHTEYFQSLGLICLKLTAYVDICAVIFIAHTYMYI